MRFGWRGAVGLVVTIALLWWALHEVSLATVASQLRSSNVWLFVLSAIVATVIFALRAARWQVILAPVGTAIPFGAAWRATTIGMMVNNVAPARAGEIARAYALTRELPRVPFAASIASLAVDRVFDGVALLLLGLIAIMDPALPATAQIAGRSIGEWAGTGTVLVAAVLAVLYALVVFPDALVRSFALIARRLSPRIEERGRSFLLAFSDGLGALRSPRRFLLVLAWTLLHWVVNAYAFWLGFRAVGLELPFTAAFLVQALTSFGVAVPSSPGFFGVFEALAIVSLGLYGVDRASATTFAIGFHILSFIPVTALGAYYAARLGLRLRELEAPPTASA